MAFMVGKAIGMVLGKGGIGKTTTTQNLLAGFSIQERTGWTYVPGTPIPSLREDESATDLGADLDPQCNLTRGSGIPLLDAPRRNGTEKNDIEDGDPSVHEVLLNPQFGIQYAIKRSPSGYDLLPASRTMDNLEQELSDASVVGRDTILHRALRKAKGNSEYPITVQAIEKYKRIFFDTPRNLGILTIVAMVAADIIIVPFQPEFYADDSLDQLDRRLEQVRAIKDDIQIDGVLITMFDKRLALHREFEKKIRGRYGDRVFEQVIPRNVSLAEAPGFGRSIFEYAPESAGAVAYMNVVIEMKDRFNL